MANGGGQVFTLPPEFYGGVGLGQAAGQMAGYLRDFADRTTQQKDKRAEELMRQLQVAEQVFGRGSPQFAALAREITGEQNAQPLVPVAEQQNRALTAAQQRIATGQGTPDDITLVNQAMFSNPLGLSGIREEATSGQRVRHLQVTGAERTETDEQERRRILADRGQTVGGLAASFDINKITAAEEEVNNLRARTSLTREQVNTERAQQTLIRAQRARLLAEAREAAAGNNPFAAKDAEYLAGLRVRLEQAGIVVPSTQYLVAGLNGQLGEGQGQFNTAYGLYVSEQRQEWESTVARAIEENPNSARARAARNLQAYQQAIKNGGKVNGVTDQQLAEWNATVMGGTATRQEGWFRDRWVINWTPPGTATPAPASPGRDTTTTRTTRPSSGAAQFDSGELTRTIISLIGAQQGNLRDARARLASRRNALNQQNPGSGDALLSRFDAMYPSAVPRTQVRQGQMPLGVPQK